MFRHLIIAVVFNWRWTEGLKERKMICRQAELMNERQTDRHKDRSRIIKKAQLVCVCGLRPLCIDVCECVCVLVIESSLCYAEPLWVV